MKTLTSILLLTVALALPAHAQEKIVQAYQSIAGLLYIDPNIEDNTVACEGLNASGDGGGGMMRYYPSSSTATNATTVFKPINFGGRWIMVFGGPGNSGSALAGALVMTGTPTVGDYAVASTTTGTNGVWTKPLWLSYTSTDIEGGTVYGTASTNAFLPKAFDFAVNNLTNAWSGTSMVMNMGAAYDAAQPDVNGLAQHSVDIFMFGGNLNRTPVTNSGTFFLLGYNLIDSEVSDSFSIYSLGESMTSSYFSDSSEYYSIGARNFASSTNVASSHDNHVFGPSNLGNSYFSGAIDAIFIGVNSGDGLRMINNEDTFTFGQHTLGGVAVLDSTHDIMAIQNPALFNAKITNSYVITAISGGNGAVLNDSKNVLFLGQGAGDLISGAYTNIVFIGDGATIGFTNGENAIIAGTSMTLSVGATNRWQFQAPVDTTNLTVVVDGVTYKLATVP